MKEIDLKIKKVHNLLELETIRICRNFIKDQNNNAHSFTIAMGTYFFCDEDNNILNDLECKNFESFLDKYNAEFKITGNPMNFKATGKIIRQW